MVVGAIVLIVAIIGVVGAVVVAQQNKQARVGTSTAVPAAAGAMGEGFVANKDVTLVAGAPTLDVYEDFQCPACAQFEQVMGATIDDLASQGKVKLVYHLKTIIDANMGTTHSLTMANAALCAADAGKWQPFHDDVFANQPATEGQGWTDAQTKGFAEKAGISGSALDTWSTCVEERTYAKYVESTEDASGKAGITGTPTVLLGGEKVDFQQVSTPDALVQAVAAATK
ncbi:membrane protein [Knoellia subterranea KCTC 19937]|uniref:Membrane protein n=1 Tax=Knoellia subterranea KCTC 19937 TaxID=1385521 RepID=A0A0A0JRX4_9MICO|nr:membrane protein [Knoellia subterranea KCTC 19937]